MSTKYYLDNCIIKNRMSGESNFNKEDVKFIEAKVAAIELRVSIPTFNKLAKEEETFIRKVYIRKGSVRWLYCTKSINYEKKRLKLLRERYKLETIGQINLK